MTTHRICAFLLVAGAMLMVPDRSNSQDATVELPPTIASRPAATVARLPPEPAPRPPALTALYAGFVTLQALDAHSTIEAVNAGHLESNPIVAPFSQSPAAMYAMKAATTTATILLVEKLRRRHRGAAIGLMIAANVAYATVVAHNYRR